MLWTVYMVNFTLVVCSISFLVWTKNVLTILLRKHLLFFCPCRPKVIPNTYSISFQLLQCVFCAATQTVSAVREVWQWKRQPSPYVAYMYIDPSSFERACMLGWISTQCKPDLRMQQLHKEQWSQVQCLGVRTGCFCIHSRSHGVCAEALHG